MTQPTVDVENAGVVIREDYERVLKEIVAGGFCPFCEEHLFKHHRHPILVQNEHWLATKNAWPYKGSSIHILFIARTHLERMEDLSPSMWNGLHELYQKIVELYHIDGATLFMRSGNTRKTGASVNHLHAQMVVGGERREKPSPITALIGFKK